MEKEKKEFESSKNQQLKNLQEKTKIENEKKDEEIANYVN